MNRIKVLPVYPEFPLTFWSYKGAVEIVGKKASMPPTGLATVLAMLPDEHFTVQPLVDMNVEELTDKHIQDADILFTSTMLIQESAHNAVVARAHRFGKKVVAGGPFVTTYPEKTDADFIVGGEAEVTLPVFLEDLLNGATKGIWTEESVAHRSVAHLTRTGKIDVTNTPLPRWDLLNLENYASAAIQYSRGCPFNCDFCDITKLFGREPRTKTPEQMTRELDALHTRGHRGSVFIVDDNFIGNLKNVRQLLPVLKGWQERNGYPYSLFTEASMNLAADENADILQGMHDAGFDFVFLGIESVDNDVLRGMKKSQNTRMSQLEAVRRIQKAGLEVSGGFIIGSDGENEQVFDGLFDFIQQAGIPVPMPGLLTVIKGTDLYKRLETEGRLRSDSNGNNVYQRSFNFTPQLDERFLVEGYKDLVSRLYDPENYYARCRTLQHTVGPSNYKRGFSINDLAILGRSLGRQMFREGGWEYLKYVTETALTNPRYIGTAFAHAIKFDHFRKIKDEMSRADAYVPHTDSLYEHFSHEAGRIYANGKLELQERLRLISNRAHAVVDRAEGGFIRLHKDFRSGAQRALDSLKVKIGDELTRYGKV